jgi:hypothetical protein
MSDPDAEAFEHYDDPARREPASGRPNRRPDRALTEHVPVRFPAATIEAVRALAEADGMTVSAWIRRSVERAIHARVASPASPAGQTTAQTLIERLERDVAELAAALERSEAR